MPLPKLKDIKWVTTDCYGTLIDWESGIWDALQPLLWANDRPIGRADVLAEVAASMAHLGTVHTHAVDLSEPDDVTRRTHGDRGPGR